MYVPDRPRFELRWLRPGAPPRPSWLDDPAWIPQGEQELYAAAKNGLASALSGLCPRGSATALLPVYVPAGVVHAARSAGYDVRYYPVGRDLRLDLEAVERRLSNVDPDVFLLIHYFGFADPASDDLVESAHRHGATVVEDCARALFSRDSQRRLLGTRGDLALFCLHKTLAAPHGGLLVGQGVDLPDPEGTVGEFRSIAVSAAVSTARLVGIRPSRQRPEIDVGTEWSSDAADERPFRLSGPGRLSALALAQTDPATVRAARLERYRALRPRLCSVDGLTVLTPPAHDGACPYGVAVRVPSRELRDDVALALYDAGLPSNVLTWPLCYRTGTTTRSPGGTILRNQLLVLPTHQQLPLSSIPEIESTVEAAVQTAHSSDARTAGGEVASDVAGSAHD